MFAKKILPELNQALEENNINSPISIQKDVFSKIKSGVDLVWSVENGMGKTTLLAISVINQIKQALNDVPRAIIISSDIENAFSTTELCKKLARHTNIRIFCAHAKGVMDDLEVEIYNGSDIVIGTPAKIGEFYSTNVLNLTALKMLIFDDIDKINKQSDSSQLGRISTAVENAQKLIFTEKIDIKTERLIETHFKSPWIFD